MHSLRDEEEDHFNDDIADDMSEDDKHRLNKIQ